MEDNSTTHALTEVALALAMAFFSIMVLAMVSMSVPRQTAEAIPVPKLPKESINLVDAKKPEEQQPKADSKPAEDGPKRTYVFYFNNRFYNEQLKPVAVGALPSEGTVVLALPPALTVQRALAIQAQINRPDMVITQLNPQWQQRLETL